MTPIVVGNFRGGTTAVAHILIAAGVDMGKNLPYTLEDPEFQVLFHERRVSRKEIRNLIAAREGLWGFKYPHAYKQLGRLIGEFDDPRVIVVFRDPMAVALSSHHRTGADLKKAMRFANRVNSQLSSIVLPCPVLWISFEHLLTKEETIVKILAFLEINADIGPEIINIKKGYANLI